MRTKIKLPPPNIRTAGAQFKRDDYFVGSGIVDAERLRWHYGMVRTSRILDIGCGPGRTLIGLVESGLPYDTYVGIDVCRETINWADKNLSRYGEFMRLDVQNARYHPKGKPLTKDFQFQIRDDSFDIVTGMSLFTHMRLAHVRIYLKEIHRVLKPGGRAFVTAFVRLEGPDVEENPEGYPPGLSKGGGALHRVVFRKDVIADEICEAGLSISRWNDEGLWNVQTEIGLTKPLSTTKGT